MQSWKRARAPNFSMEEKDLLVEIINRHKHILDNNRTDHVSIQEKQETWLQVAAEFNVNATTDRNWRCLKTAYENIKKKMKRDNLVFSDLVREHDDRLSDEQAQLPLSVVLDVGERESYPTTALNSIVKIEKELPEVEADLKQAKCDGRGLIGHASKNPLTQWANWQSMSNGGTSNRNELESLEGTLQSPSVIPESNVTTSGSAQSILCTSRPENRLFKPCCNPQKRTAFHKRMANERRGRNFVELALVKRRYYQRLLEIAEEQHETKLRMAEMAEEQHAAKLKMIEAKTNFFLQKLGSVYQK